MAKKKAVSKPPAEEAPLAEPESEKPDNPQPTADWTGDDATPLEDVRAITKKNLDNTGLQPAPASHTVVVEVPVDDALTGGYMDKLPRYISGMGLSRNTLAQRGLQRIHRALYKRAKLSTGRLVERNSQAVQWVLERIAEAEAE